MARLFAEKLDTFVLTYNRWGGKIIVKVKESQTCTGGKICPIYQI